MLELKYMLARRGRTALQAAVPSLSPKQHKMDKKGARFNLLLGREVVPQLMSEMRILLT